MTQMPSRRRVLQHAAAAPLALSLPAARAQRDSRLLIGQSAAMSGPAAQLGQQMNLGARLAFEQANAAGGVNGARLELVALDDGYDPDRCRANTERLLNDNVFALFGFVGTPTCLAAQPLSVEAKVPFIAPFTGALGLRDPFQRHVFHVRASYDDETALIVRQLTSLGLKRVAVLRQNDAYGQAGLDGVTKALKAQGLAPVAVGTVERNSVAVSDAVQAIVAARPDGIVQISAYKSCAAFVREARRAGYGGQFYNVSFVGTQALADELGKEARGVMISQVMPFPYGTTTPIVRDYQEALKTHGNGQRPDYTSMEGYLTARVFLEGLRRGRTNTREALVTGLESMQNVDFGGFPVSFGPRDHVGSHFVEISMLTEGGTVRR